MSTNELKRAGVLARVAAETLTLRSAAALMAVSYRQAKRLYGRYREKGAAGLRHGSAGRASNRAPAARIRKRVLALVRAKYGGGIDERFGPTLAAEHLASEDGIAVDHETLRRWMLAAGLWSRARKRSPHRRRRECQAHFGESCGPWIDRFGIPARHGGRAVDASPRSVRSRSNRFATTGTAKHRAGQLSRSVERRKSQQTVPVLKRLVEVLLDFFAALAR